MPAGDRTGPMGIGPMTGRGAGYCAGYSVPGFVNPMAGRGWGVGFGRGRGGGGRGWRHWFYATGLPFWARTPVAAPVPGGQAPAVEYEAQSLRVQAEQLEKALEAIRSRIAEIEAAGRKPQE